MLGRFVLGAPLALLALAREEVQRLKTGERQAWSMWLSHGTVTLLMLLFIGRYKRASGLALPVAGQRAGAIDCDDPLLL